MASKMRLDNELPEATAEWGWKYHHTGIPTKKVMPDERYLPEYRLYVSGFSTSPFGIEWMRYEKGSPVSKIIRSVPHLAFEVEDVEVELQKHNFKVISPPNAPSNGCRVAMIEYDGAIIELIEFKK